ncbi:MAG TPA: 2Fe-2S iron-sulfur cluster-binding protein [Polyangiaceae bacterium]|nr:2Fe-2S iron-sulfur cluster-binding protein [Polyangiaceae bacterium]
MVELLHDGDVLSAVRGEPLALSLIAADRLLLSRSPKLHRPRGPYCLRDACEGCLVRVNGLPNQPACRVLVQGNERVETQNVLGTRETDLLSAADFLFPQGIDHHRLMAGVPGASALVGSVARRIAGLGKLAEHAPAVQVAERVELPVLIVGGGRSGLSAAQKLGARATLCDDGHELGGALTALEPARAKELVSAARASGARLLPRTSVVALSREPEDGSGRLTALLVGPERTLVARVSAVVLATGRHDAVPSFPNNDLPGVFSARAALYCWQNDVLVGKRIALVGGGRFAERMNELMSGAVELVPLEASSVVRAVGRERVSAVEVLAFGAKKRIKVDALAFDGPGAPSFELAVQAGASVDFQPDAGYFPRAADGDGRVADGVYLASGALRALLGAG